MISEDFIGKVTDSSPERKSELRHDKYIVYQQQNFWLHSPSRSPELITAALIQHSYFIGTEINEDTDSCITPFKSLARSSQRTRRDGPPG